MKGVRDVRAGGGGGGGAGAAEVDAFGFDDVAVVGRGGDVARVGGGGEVALVGGGGEVARGDVTGEVTAKLEPEEDATRPVDDLRAAILSTFATDGVRFIVT